MITCIADYLKGLAEKDIYTHTHSHIHTHTHTPTTHAHILTYIYLYIYKYKFLRDVVMKGVVTRVILIFFSFRRECGECRLG